MSEMLVSSSNLKQYFFYVPVWILQEKDVKHSEALVFSLILNDCENTGKCVMTNREIGQIINFKKGTVGNLISHLAKLRFIKVNVVSGFERTITVLV